MCLDNALGKSLLLISLISLAACAGGGEGDAPSLDADDIWDQMAVERQKPVLAKPKSTANSAEGANDSADTLYDWPGAVQAVPLSGTDREGFRAHLRAADKSYQTIRKALEAAMVDLDQETGDAAEGLARERTLHLHLSRLANLKNTLGRAMRALAQEPDDADQALLEQTGRLVAVMADFGNSLRRRFD